MPGRRPNKPPLTVGRGSHGMFGEHTEDHSMWEGSVHCRGGPDGTTALQLARTTSAMNMGGA